MWQYSSFWYKNFDEMAQKTLIRQLISRWGIMSTEMERAFINDSHIPTVDPKTGEIVADKNESADEVEFMEAPRSDTQISASAQLQENAGEPEQIDLNSL